MWAWSSGRSHGLRSRTNSRVELSNFGRADLKAWLIALYYYVNIVRL
jgi:hypothetical protein